MIQAYLNQWLRGESLSQLSLGKVRVVICSYIGQEAVAMGAQAQTQPTA